MNKEARYSVLYQMPFQLEFDLYPMALLHFVHFPAEKSRPALRPHYQVNFVSYSVLDDLLVNMFFMKVI